MSDIRERLARIIALAGLGTVNGEPRQPPGNWIPEEWDRRVLECIPCRAESRCYELADTVLTELSTNVPEEMVEAGARAMLLKRGYSKAEVDLKQRRQVNSWTEALEQACATLTSALSVLGGGE